MKENEIFHHLGLEPRGLFITKFSVDLWGSRITLECNYDYDNPKVFHLTFEHCREIQWFLVNDENITDEIADVILFSLGQSLYKERASIITDIFQIMLSYENFTLAKDWEL
jgi:hypothetical protein